MQLNKLIELVQSLGPAYVTTRLPSGYIHLRLLTPESKSVKLDLSTTLANSLNLVKDGDPLLSAVNQANMYTIPASYSTIPDFANLLLCGNDVIYCDISDTYIILHQGFFSWYVDATGKCHSCWSYYNDRKSNK